MACKEELTIASYLRTLRDLEYLGTRIHLRPRQCDEAQKESTSTMYVEKMA